MTKALGMARNETSLSKQNMLRSELKASLLVYLRSHHADICRHWFDLIEPSVIVDGVLRLVVQEPVQLKYLQRCCLPQFAEAAQAVTGCLVVVRFVSPTEDQQLVASGRSLSAPGTAPDGGELPSWLDEQMVISPDYTFDSFVEVLNIVRVKCDGIWMKRRIFKCCRHLSNLEAEPFPYSFIDTRRAFYNFDGGFLILR